MNKKAEYTYLVVLYIPNIAIKHNCKVLAIIYYSEYTGTKVIRSTQSLDLPYVREILKIIRNKLIDDNTININNLLSKARDLYPLDDSSLQIHLEGKGITSFPDKVLEHLCNAYFDKEYY